VGALLWDRTTHTVQVAGSARSGGQVRAGCRRELVDLSPHGPDESGGEGNHHPDDQ
jgi:hypothetical protein